MQAEDGLDEPRDPGGRAAELAKEAPGLEGRRGLFDEGTDLRVGPVHRLLAGGQCVPSSPGRDADGASGAAIVLVGPAGDVGVGEGVDDAVFARRPHAVDSAGQGG